VTPERWVAIVFWVQEELERRIAQLCDAQLVVEQGKQVVESAKDALEHDKQALEDAQVALTETVARLFPKNGAPRLSVVAAETVKAIRALGSDATVTNIAARLSVSTNTASGRLFRGKDDYFEKTEEGIYKVRKGVP
jgi:hypothetical protein